LPDRRHAHVGKARLRCRPDAPHQIDGQGMQEGNLVLRIDDDQSVGFGDLRSDLGEILGARDAN
jgi:hypothetical protein